MTRSSAPPHCRITSFRRSLRTLDRALADLTVAMRTHKPAAGPAKADRRCSPRRTAAGLAALKFQGQYMGDMRPLKPAQKALVRAVKAKSGTKAAIRKAQELAGKKNAA